jgi:UDP-N-acetylglucosamine 2-epimerase
MILKGLHSNCGQRSYNARKAGDPYDEGKKCGRILNIIDATFYRQYSVGKEEDIPEP